MEKKNDGQQGQQIDTQTLLEQIQKESTDLAVVQKLFGEETQQFLAIQQRDPLLAATLFTEKKFLKNKKGKGTAQIKKELAHLRDVLTQKTQEIRAELSPEVEAETPDEAEQTSAPVLEISNTAEHKKQQAEIIRQLHILKLADSGISKQELETYDDRKLKELVKLHAEKKETETRSQDIFLARQYLRNKISNKKLEGMTGLQIIQKAEEIAKTSIEQIREALVNQTDTSRELNRVLNPRKLELIKSIIKNKNIPIVTHEKPDLDAKSALYLLTSLTGVTNKEIQYIPKGGTADKGILLDVGRSDEITTVDKERWEIDHHFENKRVKTSSTETILEILKRAGYEKKIEPWMSEFVTFVTDVDNMSYPRQGREWFKENYPKTILGLRNALSIETIASFFKANKNPYEPLSDEEMLIEVQDAQGAQKPLKELVTKMANLTERSIRGIELNENRNVLNGVKVFSNKFGKTLFCEKVDTNQKFSALDIPLGSHAVYNMGYDTYAIYDQKEKFYFISSPGQELSPLRERINQKDPNAKTIRGSMLMSQGNKESKTASIGLRQTQFLNYIGLNIARESAQVEVSVEYETKRILIEQQHILGIYSKRLEGVGEMFQTNIDKLDQNIKIFEDTLATGMSGKKPMSDNQKKAFEEKIKILQYEKILWQSKLELLQSIKNKPQSEYFSLVDKNKINNNKNTENQIEESSTVIIENIEASPEDIAAQLAEVVAEYTQVCAKLENTECSKQELRELLVAHYNLWQLGVYLQNGATGERPADITWDELKPILREQRDTTAKAAPVEVFVESTPAETLIVSEPTVTTESKIDTTTPETTSLREYSESSPGLLTHCYFKDGDYVEAGQTIYDFTSEKTNTEVQATESGIIRFQIKTGDPFNAGDLIATIQPGEKPVTEPEQKPETTYTHPETLFAPENKNSDENTLGEEHDEDDLEQIPIKEVTRDRMLDFIRSSLLEAFKKQDTEARRTTDLILSPLKMSTEQAKRCVFTYTLKNKNGTGTKIEGSMYLPDTADPYFFVYISPKEVTYTSDENILKRGLSQLSLLAQKSLREKITANERERLETILNDALRKEFSGFVPIVKTN